MAGIFGYRGPRETAEERLQQMASRMTADGIGEANFFRRPAAGVGGALSMGFGWFKPHAVVSNNFAPQADAFVHHETGDVTLLDGYLTNARHVFAILRAAQIKIDFCSDAELVGRSLRLWRTEALRHFEGAFAIAHLDGIRNTLLLARDIFGLKPMYVATGLGSIAFASTVRSVLASDTVTADIDPDGLASYLAYGTCIEPLTLHKGVEALPAGTFRLLPQPFADESAIHGTHAPESVTQPDRGDTAATALETAIPAFVPAARSPIGVLVTADPQSLDWANRLHLSGVDVVGLTIAYEDGSGHHAAVATRNASDSSGVAMSSVTVDREWFVSHWRELHRNADSPSANGIMLALAASLAAEKGLGAVFTTLGARYAADDTSLVAQIPTNRLGRALYRQLPPKVQDAILTVYGIVSWRHQAEARAALHGQTRAVCRTQRRRVLADRDLRLLGVRVEETRLTQYFLPADYGSGELPRLNEFFIGLAGPDRDPCIAAMTRDASMFGVHSSIGFLMPWLTSTALPTQDRPAPKSDIESTRFATVCSEDADALPLSAWLKDSVSVDCHAAIDELASLPLLETAGVRQLWARVQSGVMDIDAAMMLVALGLYLENLRLRDF